MKTAVMTPVVASSSSDGDDLDLGFDKTLTPGQLTPY